MESGSLLSEALQYIQQLRDDEQQVGYLHGLLDQEGEGHHRSQNALILSIYCIDANLAVATDAVIDIDMDGGINNMVIDRKALLRRLGTIHDIIHSKLLPVYERRYKHNWFQGGEGLCFGMHCGSSEREDMVKDAHNVPHLRAVVPYGPHPLDEHYAMAVMKCITEDLFRHHGIRVAIECWDVDDGQILLIEGADELPSWVDDEIGVRGMIHRVYMIQGKVVILPPSIRGRGREPASLYQLTRREAIHALMMQPDSGWNWNGTTVTELHRLNTIIQKRLHPFCTVLNRILDTSTKRSLLGEYLHTAAIVLPLPLALIIRNRPDLIPLAIVSFCHHIDKIHPTSSSSRMKSRKGVGEQSSATHSTTGTVQDTTIPFENLVYTSITISKTLYAMLLTAAGQLPPPLKLPKHYKSSIELKRIKRQCINGGDMYAHLRHSIEAGVRLSLGFEWLLSSQNSTNRKKNDVGQVRDGEATIIASSYSTEDRITQFMTRIDMEAGGDGRWITGAWKIGPNATTSDNDISTLLKCPVWYPEIVRGGICPLGNPGKGLYQHITEVIKYARKQERESSSNDISKMFPFPRMNEVDSDEWIDFASVDDLEARMRELVNIPPSSSDGVAVSGKGKGNDNNRDAAPRRTCNDGGKGEDSGILGMNAMLGNLEKFIEGKSDIEGVCSSSLPKKDKNASSVGNLRQFAKQKEEGMDLNINSGIFLEILHRTLKSKNSNDICLDDIGGASGAHSVDDEQLLQYFTKEDLKLDGCEVEEAYIHDQNMGIPTGSRDDPVTMNEVMETMDEELADKSLQLDRGNNGEYVDESVSNLSPNDPTAMRAKVLSNIMESLDSQGGASGPVTNLLAEIKNS